MDEKMCKNVCKVILKLKMWIWTCLPNRPLIIFHETLKKFYQQFHHKINEDGLEIHYNLTDNYKPFPLTIFM